MTDFPNTPVTGDTFTSNDIERIYDGTKWHVFAKKYSYIGSLITSVSNVTQLDLSIGNFFELNLSENTEVQFYNPPSSGFAQKFYLKLKIESEGVASIAWPTSLLWETGSAPTTPELDETDLLEFYTSDGGTTYYAKLVEDNIS